MDFKSSVDVDHLIIFADGNGRYLVRALIWESKASNRPANGPDMPAWKRGFCCSRAANSVEPDRGRPEMKCRAVTALSLHPDHRNRKQRDRCEWPRVRIPGLRRCHVRCSLRRGDPKRTDSEDSDDGDRTDG